MNKYDNPPILMATDPKTIFDALDADRFAEANIETKPARFIVFAGEDTNLWVLRSYANNRDYPFLSRNGAVDVIELMAEGFVPPCSSPSEINAYGEPLENVEVFE